jgi:hypothetical protein
MFLCNLDGYTARTARKPLTLDSLEKRFHTFLLEVYHRRPSSEGKLSPKERWERGGFLPRMPDTVERLDLLLIHEVRTHRVSTRDAEHIVGADSTLHHPAFLPPCRIFAESFQDTSGPSLQIEPLTLGGYNLVASSSMRAATSNSTGHRPGKSRCERSRDFFITQRGLPGHCNPINLAGFSFAIRSISACVNPCPRNPA